MQKKVLAADDNKDLLELFTVFLNPPEYLLETASTKRRFLSKVKSFKPDVVILDVFFDGEDGREMCKEIKQNQKNKNIIILITSANPYALEKYKDFEADDFMKKPFTREELHEKIEHLLAAPPTSEQ
ncbi:response regulator [soil metagenome]